jgi:precorrin-6A synthase
MLDGGTAFETLAPEGIHIWWGAYVGMPEEILISGPLADTAARITAARQQARQRHGWIMHTYILKRAAPAPRKSV